MRDRLMLAGLGVLLIASAVLVFRAARIEPPADPVSALVDEHDHANEVLPPAPIGRTLFGGNSGKLRASPVAGAGAAPASYLGTPTGNLSLEVFAPARFQATPEANPSEQRKDDP